MNPENGWMTHHERKEKEISEEDGKTRTIPAVTETNDPPNNSNAEKVIWLQLYCEQVTAATFVNES